MNAQNPRIPDSLRKKRLLLIAQALLLSNLFFWTAFLVGFSSWSLALAGFISVSLSVVILFLISKYIKKQIQWLQEQQELAEQNLEKLKRNLRIRTGRADYLESVLQNSMDPLFTTDSENVIFKFNAGASKLFGYKQEDVLGKSLDVLFKDKPHIERLVRKVRQKGTGGTSDIRAIDADGNIIFVTLSVAKLQEPGEDNTTEDKSSDDNSNEGKSQGLVFSCRDITARKRKERKMERLSKTDELTGLLNRRQFDEDFAQMVEQCRKNPGKILTLMLIDLDNFKELNDTQGHKAGDRALRTFSNALRRSVRLDTDPAYRYGGDEFIVLLPDADEEQAQVVAQRIRKSYAEMKDEKNHTTISVGMVNYDGEESAGDLFQRADAAMYKDKKRSAAEKDV